MGEQCLAKIPKANPSPNPNSCSKTKDSIARLTKSIKDRWPNIQQKGLVSLGILGRTLGRVVQGVQVVGIGAQVVDFVYDSPWEKGYRKLLDLERECRFANSKPCIGKAIDLLKGDSPSYVTYAVQSLGGDETGPVLVFMCTGNSNSVEDNARARVKFLSDPFNKCDKAFQKAIDEDENLKYFLTKIGLGGDGPNPISSEEMANGCNLTDAGLDRVASLLDELNSVGGKIKDKDSQCSRVFSNKSIASLTPPSCLFSSYKEDEAQCEIDTLVADQAWNKFIVKDYGDGGIIRDNATEARQGCIKLRRDFGQKTDEIKNKLNDVFKDIKYCSPTCASFGKDSTKCIQNSCKWDGVSCSNRPLTQFNLKQSF